MECCTKSLKSIIVADDDAEDQELFCIVVNDLAPDIEIETVRSGRELLDVLRTKTTDLLFLDINMFPISGIDVLKAFGEQGVFDRIPVVMFSSSGRPQDMHQSYELGASLFIRKSDTFQDMKALLKTALELDWTDPKKIREQYWGTSLKLT